MSIKNMKQKLICLSLYAVTNVIHRLKNANKEIY